jgi:hypothetical protein
MFKLFLFRSARNSRKSLWYIQKLHTIVRYNFQISFEYPKQIICSMLAKKYSKYSNKSSKMSWIKFFWRKKTILIESLVINCGEFLAKIACRLRSCFQSLWWAWVIWFIGWTLLIGRFSTYKPFLLGIAHHSRFPSQMCQDQGWDQVWDQV